MKNLCLDSNTVIVVDKVVLSDDMMEEEFVCNLDKCKGACCVEGDLGAPLNDDELEKLEEVYEAVKPYMSEEGIKEVERQGKYIKDFEGDYSTPTINNRECAYAIYDDKKYLHCAIEKAYLDEKITYRKPISCYLYPARITNYEAYDAVNYDKWEICSDACILGKELKVPVYQFLKGPLTAKYGAEWYEKLEQEIQLMKENLR